MIGVLISDRIYGQAKAEGLIACEHRYSVRVVRLEIPIYSRSPIAFGNQTILGKNFALKIHGFASLPHSRFAFIVCNRKNLLKRTMPSRHSPIKHYACFVCQSLSLQGF